MPIEDRNVKAGTVLVARYRGAERTLEVVQTGAGVRYRLDDGQEFKSPSSAGKAVMDGIACNGWRFWSVQGEEPARRERASRPAKVAAHKKGAAKKLRTKARANGGKKAKWARMAAKGGAYGCGACGESFPTMKGATQHALTHTSA